MCKSKIAKDDWALPRVDAVDLLVVMGGSMRVHDDSRYPWLMVEKGSAEWIDGPFIQSPEAIKGAPLPFAESNAVMDKAMDYLLEWA